MTVWNKNSDFQALKHTCYFACLLCFFYFYHFYYQTSSLLLVLFKFVITFHPATAFPVFALYCSFSVSACTVCFSWQEAVTRVFMSCPAGQFIWEQNCELVAASIPSSPRVNVMPEWTTTGLLPAFHNCFLDVPCMCSPRSSVLQSHLPLAIFCISVPWVRHACSSATPLMPSQESIFPQCEYRYGNYSYTSVDVFLKCSEKSVCDPQIWQLLCQCYGGWQTCQLRPLGYSRTRGLWSP